MSECEINPCVKQEYESELQPQPIPSQQFIQEYDSLDDIKNPLPYTIYSVGDSKYYYENGEFVQLCSGSGGGGSSLPLRLELIGTWTGYLPTLDINAEGATSDKISDTTNTQININNTNYRFILITIECDGDPSTLPDYGCGKFSMALCSQHAANGNLQVFATLNVRGPHASLQDVAGVSSMTSYGITLTNNRSNVIVNRGTWGGSCPAILGGNYTVNAYGVVGF